MVWNIHFFGEVMDWILNIWIFFFFFQVREAQIAQYNYILVVGAKEADTGKVCSLQMISDLSS